MLKMINALLIYNVQVMHIDFKPSYNKIQINFIFGITFV